MRDATRDTARDLSRPAVFRAPGALMYAGNCADLAAAAAAGECVLNAWTRRGYPGIDLGEALPRVCSVGGWDAVVRQSWGLREHCNEGVKIACVLRGRLALTLDGQRHDLAEGQVFVLRPWQLHAFGDPQVGPSQVVWVLFDMGTRRPHEAWIWPDWLAWPERDRRRLTEILSTNERPSYAASREVLAAFRGIAEIVARRDIACDELPLRLQISAMLMHLMGLIVAERPVLDPSLAGSRRTVRIFLDRLPLCLDEPWSLEGMAAECSLSRTQFSQHCLALVNTTPARYLQELRLAAARQMLAEDPERSVTSVALACGFSSSQYFATSFRRRYGIAPTARRAGLAA